MTDDLFPDCRQDSPRLAWMKRNEITVIHDPSIVEMQEDEFGNKCGSFCVCSFKIHGENAPMSGGTGMTLDDALEDWASKNGIPLWNEEQFNKESK